MNDKNNKACCNIGYKAHSRFALANKRRCYFVTTSLIGWTQTWNQPWGYSSEMHLQTKSHEILFAHSWLLICKTVSKICTEHGSITAVLCANFQNDLMGWMFWMNKILWDSEFEFELLEMVKPEPNHQFFIPRDLEIGPWKNNRAPLLCYFKLVHHFKINSEFKRELQSRNVQFGSKFKLRKPVQWFQR